MRGAAGAAGSRPGRAPDLACFLPIHGDGRDGIGYDSFTMKQPGPLVKVLALATSIALVAVYVTYRVANAKSEGRAAPTTPAPAPPKDGEAPPIRYDEEDAEEYMGRSSKSMVPLIAPRDLEPKPKAEPPAPGQTVPPPK